MNQRITAALSGAAIALLAGGCSSGTNLTPADPGPAVTSTPSTTASPSPTTTSPTSSATPTKTGPVEFALGETAKVTSDGKEAMSITVTYLKQSTKATEKYGKNPANGRYITVTVTAKSTGDADPTDASVNPFDFYLVSDDGQKYQYGAGNVIGSVPYDGALNATQLNPGEQVKGTVSFDAPTSNVRLAYAPMSRILGYWKIT